MKLVLALIASVMMASSFAADPKPTPATTQDVRPPVPNVSPEEKAKNKMLLAKKKKDKKVKKDATKSPTNKSK
jgi:hypothetical protein